MKLLPPEVSPYKKTPTFDEETVPKGLLSDHRTLEGVWGRIVVLEGELSYTIKGEPDEVIVLSPGTDGVVEPQVVHFVRPKGKVKFFVQFYK